MRVADGDLARVTVTTRRYRCAAAGDVGPLTVTVRPGARIGRGGRFSFSAGVSAERLPAAGTASRDRVRGSFRVAGTIGTGEPCRSPRLRFSARAARRG